MTARLCRNCRFLEREDGVWGTRYYNCTHPDFVGERNGIDVVTGKQQSRSCYVARTEEFCGKVARFFQPQLGEGQA